MKITRTSPHSGLENTMDLPITEQQMADWMDGKGMIQDLMPHLNAEQREFLITGCTPLDWAEMFPPICDSCRYSVIDRTNFELRCNSTQSVFYGCAVEPEHSCDQWKAS